MPRFFSLFNYSKKILPRISNTEKIALTCGTIGFDKTIFSGDGNVKELLKYKPKLSKAEESYLNYTVEDICHHVSKEREQIGGLQAIPKSIIQRMSKDKIFGMLIPPEYNGIRFNTHARSQIVQKLSSCNGAVGVVAMVPNSLGPGELLIHYGTDSQKNYYLPKLARGELIPCFGLTSWAAGSDAAGSMIDTAIVKRDSQGERYLEVSVNKRYITLAPIASVIGLAVKLTDPDNLLKEGGEGISVLLLEKSKFPEINTSNCHNPLNVGFPNGTIKANKIRVPLDTVIGGEEKCGEGWRMLMECLSEGRAVSLPATAVSASKTTTLGTLAYSRVRSQFKTPIHKMEGVAEKLAEMVINTTTITSAQYLTNAMIDNNEKPSVISAVMKQITTEKARETINHSMDVMGGSGICLGKNNFVADFYKAAPIGITVEGSNTLTRSLIIFGQGLMRSHPYLLNIVESIENDKRDVFYRNVGSLIFSSISNTLVCLTPLLSNNRETHLERLTKSFYLYSNVMLTLGKRFKTSEMLSGRYADIFSNIYLAYSLLWYKESYNCSEGMRFIIDKSVDKLMYDIQDNFKEIESNFKGGLLAKSYLKLVAFPYGKRYSRVSDRDKLKIVEYALGDKSVRDFLSENIYLGENNYYSKLIETLSEKEIDSNTIKELCQVNEYKIKSN